MMPPGPRLPNRSGPPVFLDSDDLEELACQDRRSGCSVAYRPNVYASDREQIRAIREAFSDSDVIEQVALSEAVGARCCVYVAGSDSPDVWYGPRPKNLSDGPFDATVDDCLRAIDEIKPTRTKSRIEVMGWVWPDSADAQVRMVRTVDREVSAVHFDTCNLIDSPRRFDQNPRLIQDCFGSLGRRALSCRARDLAWEAELNVHFREVIQGRGEVDDRPFLIEFAQAPAEAPLMSEHPMSPEGDLEAFDCTRQVGAEVEFEFV